VALQQIEEGSLERYVPNLERNYSGGGWHPWTRGVCDLL